ncbi:MAG: hypothetical protein H8E44_05410 [Planctomycetes bacterium]|nr:hypothetical protein [Planctomycetota bacterium]
MIADAYGDCEAWQRRVSCFQPGTGVLITLATVALVVVMFCGTAVCAGPVRGPDLILWLDAQDIDGDGKSGNNLASGAAVVRWRDKSEHANHAMQATPDRQPTYSQGVWSNPYDGPPRPSKQGDSGQSTGSEAHRTAESQVSRSFKTRSQRGAAPSTVRFNVAKRQFLSVRNGTSLRLSHITAFVVAKAYGNSANMWLFGKNSFSQPWSGYGIAVHGGQVSPWPHLGLGYSTPGQNGYLRYDGNIRQRLAIVEIAFDGKRLRGLLNGRIDGVQSLDGGIRANDRDLLIGASPQSLPAGEFLQGEIAEVLIYNRALNEAERRQTRDYLAAKYELTVAEDSRRMVVIDNGYLPVLVENPSTPETRTLTADDATAVLRRDWLFQADDRPSVARGLQEIGWAKRLAARLYRSRLEMSAGVQFSGWKRQAEAWTPTTSGVITQGPEATSWSEELRELDALEKRGAAIQHGEHTAEDAEDFYLAVRRVKRRIMFKNPVLDFSQILFIDQPYPQGPEWKHQAIHRMGHRAIPGGRLLVLEGLHPGGRVRQLFPNGPGSFWRPDLSFDANRVLFCYKAHDEASFHLYEINLDGTSLRRLTSGQYDDIDPVYLPDGHIVFTTTRGNTYVRCGPYIYSYVLARCDADGGNVYLISRNSEPDFVPALLGDGRVIYSRWEYTDKDLMRVQSLWTTNQDGTGTRVFWGNQSVWPDHLAEPRPIPGSDRVMFVGVGHHDWFSGSVGIVDPRAGTNFPDGLTKVTCDLRWAEVPDPPVDPRERADYHASGRYTGYMGAYPLSQEEFLVSARGLEDKFRLYLMDVYGNRELIYEGAYNAWYALPVKPRPVPSRHPDLVNWPGTGGSRKPVEPGLFYSADVYQGVPDLPRGTAKYLRVVQQDAKTYSTWRKTFRLSGPPVSIIQEEAVKRIVSTVPVEQDGSVYFEAPAGKALYFQLLDEHHRALQTMRSFTGLMPGETRGCVGCHEMHSTTPTTRVGQVFGRLPSEIDLPPWGTESISYERFTQPVLDRYCVKCHREDADARAAIDLTLRPGWDVFKEPYLTLVGSAAWAPSGRGPLPEPGQPGYGIAAPIPVQTMAGHNDPRGYATLRPMQHLSYRSRLVDIASSGKHYDVRVDPVSLQRLIAWVDADCPFMGESELRALGDPQFAGIDQLPVQPRVKTAPVIERP